MFKPQERQIYEYNDGYKNRKVDPMPIYLKLLDGAAPEDLEADLSAFGDGPDKQPGTAALVRLGAHAARAFGLQMWDEEKGEGMSLTDLTLLLVDFLNFTISKKKPTRVKQTKRPVTAHQSSATLTTTPILACGSIEIGPSGDNSV